MIYDRYIPIMRAAINYAIANSNDPDSQVGAFCVLGQSPDHLPRIVAKAANMILLPYETREEKLLASLHAEKAALTLAREAGLSNLKGATLVVTRHPCSHCMIDIHLSGCKSVVYLDRPEDENSSWKASFASAKTIAAKFHIDLIKVPLETLYRHTTELPEIRTAN